MVKKSEAAQQAPSEVSLLGGDFGLEFGFGFGDACVESGDIGLELDAQISDVVLGGDVLAESAPDSLHDGLRHRLVRASLLKLFDGFVNIEENCDHKRDDASWGL